MPSEVRLGAQPLFSREISAYVSASYGRLREPLVVPGQGLSPIVCFRNWFPFPRQTLDRT